MQILISFIIFFITLFIYIHINFHLTTNNDLEIFEIDEIHKDKLEEICNLKQPLLFKYNVDELYSNLNNTNINSYKTFDINIRNRIDYIENESNILPLTLKEANLLFSKDSSSNYISEYNYDFLEETTLIKHIQKNDLFLRPNLCSECNYDIIFGSTNSYTPLRYELNYRNYIYVINGEIDIMLTIPNNEKYLDIISDYDKFEFRSKFNPFNTDDTENLNKVKFLNLNLKQGDIIFIPFKWLYTIQIKTKDTIVCNLKYKVIMNSLAIIPQLIYKFLYNQNIKFKFLNSIK